MPVKESDTVNSSAIAQLQSYLSRHIALNSCLTYKYSHNTVSSSFDTIESLYYSTDSFHHQSYSIISRGRWMRGEQFYPITASGGASSKAFWPGLLPWGIAILQETHQTHERRTFRVTLLCLHHSSPHLSSYLTGSYFLWCFVLRLTKIASKNVVLFDPLFKLLLDTTTYLKVAIVLNLIGSVSRALFSSASLPHLNQRSQSRRKTSKRISFFGYILKC